MKKTICLNMIVKNESSVITRCLASVRGVIDSWAIIDTGSTDGTQAIIRDYLRDLPGELQERPWVNFAHNRNEALALARGKGDYVLFIDADETLEFSGAPYLPCEADFYFITVRYGGDRQENWRNFMVNNHLKWIWKGVVHEELFPVGDTNRSVQVIPGAKILYGEDGHRSKVGLLQKATQDAYLLQQAYDEDPTNTQTTYYLAQSYDVAQNYPLALKYYEARAKLGGIDGGHLFTTMLRIGIMHLILNYPPEIYTQSFLQAYALRPWRAEPLYHLAHHFLHINQPFIAYLISSFASKLPLPIDDPALVDLPMYEYLILEQVAASTFNLGRYPETREACLKLLATPSLPKSHITSIKQLLDQSNKQLENKYN